MTQFAIFKSNKKQSCFSKISKDTLFLYSVSKKIFGTKSIENLYYLDCEGIDIDGLFLEAQKQMNKGVLFEKTRLYKCIKMVISDFNLDEIVFWYGDDFYDLDECDEMGVFFDTLKDRVADSFCELYMHYKNQ